MSSFHRRRADQDGPVAEEDTVVGGSDTNWDVWSVDIDGRNKANPTKNPGLDINATWSPGGEHIYFLRSRDGSQNVYRMKPDGSDPEQVTYDTKRMGWPILAPDETTVLILPGESGNQEIYSIEGNERIPLAPISSGWLKEARHSSSFRSRRIRDRVRGLSTLHAVCGSERSLVR